MQQPSVVSTPITSRVASAGRAQMLSYNRHNADWSSKIPGSRFVSTDGRPKTSISTSVDGEKPGSAVQPMTR